MARFLVPVLALAAATAAACGGQEEAPPLTPAAENVFQNPGFEDGRDPWFSLKEPDFILSQDTSHTGNASARLQMRADPDHEGTKVHYLVQEVEPERLPEAISGHYRVTYWKRGTPLQYLQFAVIAFGANNMPVAYPSHQIRYILAGIDREPFDIANAHFVFLDRGDPHLDQWVSFQAKVRDDFQRLWGAVPEGYDKIRVLFEVRYDDKAPGETPEADVYYDDLYFGPAR